jgi:hypothetical protein
MKNRIVTDQHQMLVIHFSHSNKTYTLQEIEDLLGFLKDAGVWSSLRTSRDAWRPTRALQLRALQLQV